MKTQENENDKIEPILNEEKEDDKESLLKKDENIKGEEINIKNKEDKETINIKKEKPIEIKKETEKEDPLIASKKKLSLRDGILTLIGNEFHRIGFGCNMVIFNLTTYLMSYLRHYQKKKTITLQYTYFIGPVMSITMGLFTPMVGIIENKIGLKLSIVLSGILSLWSSTILYFSKNYFFDLFAFFVNSLGFSMSALLSRNSMGYFFHVRGKLSGLLSVIGSLVSSGYNIVGENWIVNPKSEEATVDDSYYTFEVCKNLLTYFRFCWACLTLGTILTVIFVVPFDKKKHIKLFAPKGFKKFDKERMENFGKRKETKKEKIKIDDKIGPLMPEDEKKEEKKKDINNKKEKSELQKEKKDNVHINLNINNKKEIDESENEKEIKLEKRDIVNELGPDLSKDKNKKKKNDFSKTTSVPAFLVTKKDKLLIDSGIIDNSEDTADNIFKIDDPLKSKRSFSVPEKGLFSRKFPLINVIPEMEVVSIVPSEPPFGKPKRKKFSIQLIKQALKSRRVLFLFLMGLFSAPLGSFLTSTWRPIGIRKGIPTRYLQNIGTYRPFITCAATLIFSTLSDYVPFRYLYFSFSILATIIGVTFSFTFKNPILFTFIILLNSVVFSGKISITGPHYMKVFGLKYYIEIGGVIGLSRVFMSPLCTVFIFLFETYIAAPENGKVSDTPYIVLFVVSGLLNVIAAVLSLFETEEKFNP